MNLSKYNKLFAHIISAGLAWWYIIMTSPSSAITSHEYYTGGILLAGAFGVYQFANAQA